MIREVPIIELVFDDDCPNAERARARVREALAAVGMPPGWTEWRADDPAAPVHVRGYGSPTVLVDGRDVAGAVPLEGARSCRLYAGEGAAPDGAPPVALIVAALEAAAGGAPGGSAVRPVTPAERSGSGE
jgi:mercuric ion transport protein